MLKSFLALYCAGLGLAELTIPFEHSLPCMTRPIIAQAGNAMEFEFFNSYNVTCQMAIAFSNPAFLPLVLDATPHNCSSNQIVNFTIPESVPNGIASVQWQCQGSIATSCALVFIEGGCDDRLLFAKQSLNATLETECVDRTGYAKRTVPRMPGTTLYSVGDFF